MPLSRRRLGPIAFGLLVVAGAVAASRLSPFKHSPPPGPPARAVTDAFLQRVLAGDASGAEAYVAENTSLHQLQDLVSMFQKEGLSLSGSVLQNGSDDFTYPLVGRTANSFVPHATFEVMLSARSNGWKVIGWIYNVGSITVIPTPCPTTGCIPPLSP
jgi:hypothetical protein